MSSPDVRVELVSMATGEDYLLRPVEAGMVSYEAIHETRLDLADFARMNDRIDVRIENESRIADSMRQAHGR